MIDCETIIVGGGPAGSSCAWELARAGRECLILERQPLPKFKLCAGWITPKVLCDLQILPGEYPHGLLELKRIRLYLGSSPLNLAFRTHQYSIRRCQFDNWLLRRSCAAVIQHHVRSIRFDGRSYVIDEAFKCSNLVGAGGSSCPVKRAFFPPDSGRLILTQEVEYEGRPRSLDCTLFYPFIGTAGYGWYVPKVGAVNVGFGGVATQFGQNVRTYWPRFVALLTRRGLIDHAPPEPSSHAYYAGSVRRTLRCGDAFIIGDAAGLATADMGEGIGPAIESGLWAAWQIRGLTAYTTDMLTKRTLHGLPSRIMSRLAGADG